MRSVAGEVLPEYCENAEGLSASRWSAVPGDQLSAYWRASKGIAMFNPTPTLVRDDAGSGSELCHTCGHPLQVHDAISLRWCAATELGIGRRVHLLLCGGRCARPYPLLTVRGQVTRTTAVAENDFWRSVGVTPTMIAQQLDAGGCGLR